MKKIILLAVVILLGWASARYFGDQYRYELYDWAIEFETSKAQLSTKYQSIEGEQFAYLEGPKRQGQESVILLHGFGASKENWVRFASYLTDHYHVIALDLSGHGENTRSLNNTYGIEDQVNFVGRMLTGLGIDRFYLIGNSMGGAISSLYTAHYPEQILATVLISPAGIHDFPSVMDEMLEKGDNPLIADSLSEFKKLLNFVMEDKPFIPAPILKVEAEKAVSRITINQKIFSDLRADIETGLASELKLIKAPVLIIWGKQDRAINVANIDRYAALIPDARKLILDDIGHLAMIETPEFTAQSVMAFFGEKKGTH